MCKHEQKLYENDRKSQIWFAVDTKYKLKNKLVSRAFSLIKEGICDGRLRATHQVFSYQGKKYVMGNLGPPITMVIGNDS